jgi:hypothetical protein
MSSLAGATFAAAVSVTCRVWERQPVPSGENRLGEDYGCAYSN